MLTSLADIPRFALIAASLGAASLALFVRYLRRAHRDRHPERFRRSVGRYGARYFFSGLGTALSIPLVVMGLHLATWTEFGSSAEIGTVKAKVKGDALDLTLALKGLPPREAHLRGRYWVVRCEVLSFQPRLHILGLRNHYRVRSVDGLADRGSRVTGASMSREEIQPSSALFRLVRELPPMPWLVTAREDATPIKEGGEAALYMVAGGTAG